MPEESILAWYRQEKQGFPPTATPIAESEAAPSPSPQQSAVAKRRARRVTYDDHRKLILEFRRLDYEKPGWPGF